MELITALLGAWFIGLFGSVHCLGMCGGIAAALSFATQGQSTAYRALLVVCYNLGRLASYALLGAALGWLVSLPGEHAHHTSHLNLPRLVAGALLIAMGLYLADWWRGLLWLERMGNGLWARLAPLSRRLMPVTHPGKALALGLLWGWLPCGLVYSALAYSAAQASPWASALTMFAFGLGTLPALLASGLFAAQLRQWLRAPALRQVIGVLVVLFGLWTLAGALGWHPPMGRASLSELG